MGSSTRICQRGGSLGYSEAKGSVGLNVFGMGGTAAAGRRSIEEENVNLLTSEGAKIITDNYTRAMKSGATPEEAKAYSSYQLGGYTHNLLQQTAKATGRDYGADAVFGGLQHKENDDVKPMDFEDWKRDVYKK